MSNNNSSTENYERKLKDEVILKSDGLIKDARWPSPTPFALASAALIPGLAFYNGYFTNPVAIFVFCLLGAASLYAAYQSHQDQKRLATGDYSELHRLAAIFRQEKVARREQGWNSLIAKYATK